MKFAKKAMALALSMAMAAICVSAFAFVLSPGTTPTALTDAFEVTSLTMTDATVITQGMRVYAPLVDTSKDKVSANQLVYFGLGITVNNPTKTLAHTSAVGNEYEVIVSSSSADLSINTMTDVVLTHPHEASAATIVSTQNGTVKANTTNALSYDKDTNALTFRLKVWNDDPKSSNVNVGNDAFNLAIDETAAAKSASFTIGFTGVNRNAVPGSVTARVSPTEYTFKNNEVTVSVNGRTYNIKKVAATWTAVSNTANWPESVRSSLSTVGYQVNLVNADKLLTEVITLDTEVTSAEGYGVSLGFVKGGRVILKSSLGNTYVYADNGSVAFTAEELARLETAMSDFGFSTAYNYKLQDKNFEQATTYKATYTVNYNTVDDEADVDEPTDEIPEEDETPDEDIPVEDIPDEDDDTVIDEEVPQTGDNTSASLCLALAALAAAALAVVLKRSAHKE